MMYHKFSRSEVKVAALHNVSASKNPVPLLDPTLKSGGARVPPQYYGSGASVNLE